MLVANLQIKNLPEKVHEALRERARKERITMSELVTDMIERDLERLRLNDWLDRNRAEAPRLNDDIDVVAVLDEVREEYDPR